MLWLRAQVMANGIKKEIQGTRFSFKDASAPRNRAPSRRLQALIGESSTTSLHQQPTPESHYRITTYYPTLDKVILEMRTRFQTNDQDILCALADVVFSQKPSEGSIALVSSFYSLDSAILEAELQIFRNFLSDNPVSHQIKKAATLVKTLYENELHTVLPVFYKASSILATIPATSCSAERSFSGLRRVKTYLRSTMGQERLSSISLLCMERAYTNRTLKNDMERIIDVFGQRSHRASHFF